MSLEENKIKRNIQVDLFRKNYCSIISFYGTISYLEAGIIINIANELGRPHEIKLSQFGDVRNIIIT